MKILREIPDDPVDSDVPSGASTRCSLGPVTASAKWGVYIYAKYAEYRLVGILHIVNGFAYFLTYLLHILHIILHILCHVLHSIVCTGIFLAIL